MLARAVSGVGVETPGMWVALVDTGGHCVPPGKRAHGKQSHMQDPVARAFSHWRMVKQLTCQYNKPEVCQSFMLPKEIVAEYLQVSPECRFTVPGANVTQLSCFPCTQLRLGTVLDAGVSSNYAAALGWWLSFFPPEQILLVNSADLSHPERRADVLNAVVKHSGVEGVPAFSQREVYKAQGYVSPQGELAQPGQAAYQRLRAEFSVPMRDFVVLQKAFWPHQAPIVPFEAV